MADSSLLSIYTDTYNLPTDSDGFEREGKVRYVIHEETCCTYFDCDACDTP